VNTIMTEDKTLTAELYLRNDASRLLGPDEMVHRAERLAANGPLGDSTVAGRWHRHQTPAENWSGEAMATYREFDGWATRNGFTLEPGFERRTRSFVGMDDTEEVVVFPYVALALYADESLVAVFPCSDEDRTYTVGSALEAFERGDEAWLRQFDPVGVERTEGTDRSDLLAD
jgi:hypothetical protein